MGVAGQNLPRLGESTTTGQPFQQADTQRIFQFGDLFRHGRLANPCPGGTPANATGLSDGVKQYQMIPIQGITISYG